MPPNTEHAARLSDAFCTDGACRRSALPQDTRAVSPAKGDGREVSARSARSRRAPAGLRRSPAARRVRPPPGLQGEGCPKPCRNFGGHRTPSQGPDPARAPLPTETKITHRNKSYPVRRTRGQPHQRGQPARPLRPDRIPRSPGTFRLPAAADRLTGPGRAGPGLGPAPGAPRTPALSARPRLRAARGRSPPRPGRRRSLVCCFSPPSGHPRQP